MICQVRRSTVEESYRGTSSDNRREQDEYRQAAKPRETSISKRNVLLLLPVFSVV